MSLPIRHGSKTGAGLWVLLAVSMSLLYSVISNSEVRATTLDWVVSALITVLWVGAALNARSGIGRVILWLIVFVQAAGWLFFLGQSVSA